VALVGSYQVLHAGGVLAPALEQSAAQSPAALAHFILHSAAAATRQVDRIAPLARSLGERLITLALELGVAPTALATLLLDDAPRIAHRPKRPLLTAAAATATGLLAHDDD
jgi:hypothetical protein